jgi:hypothetical protein
MDRDAQLLIANSPYASCASLARRIGCDHKTIAAFRAWKTRVANNGAAGVWYGETHLDGSHEPVYCPECGYRLTRAFFPLARRGNRLFSAQPCAACWVRGKPATPTGAEDDDGGLDPEIAAAAESVQANWSDAERERRCVCKRVPAVIPVATEAEMGMEAQEPQYLKLPDPGSESEWKAARRQREKHKRRVKLTKQ